MLKSMRSIYFILILLLIPFASSISTTMLPEYQRGETMIIEIQGNILEPIEHSDIVFKRNHVAVAINYDVKRVGDKYYIYAQMPLVSNNYTLFINDISATINGRPQRTDYNQTFIVSENLSDYSVEPGIIITNKDFSLIINSNLDNPLPISVNFSNIGEITIQPGQNTIPFSIDSLSTGTYTISVGKYLVPLQITSSSIIQPVNFSINVFPNIIRETLLNDTKKTYNISITNLGTIIEDIYFTFDQNLFDVSPSSISLLNTNESINLTISLKKSNELINENIFLAKENDIIANISFKIIYTSNESQITNNSNPEYYCSELNGKFCAAEEVCSGQSVMSLDGSCCIGLCAVEESSSSSWIIYVLALVVIIIIIVLYMRYQKTKLPKPADIPISSVLRKPA